MQLADLWLSNLKAVSIVYNRVSPLQNYILFPVPVTNLNCIPLLRSNNINHGPGKFGSERFWFCNIYAFNLCTILWNFIIFNYCCKQDSSNFIQVRTGKISYSLNIDLSLYTQFNKLLSCQSSTPFRAE